MASGIMNQSSLSARTMLGGLSGKVFGADDMARVQRFGMSPRQMKLNWYWSWYKTASYEARVTDWDGSRRSEGVLDHEAIASAGFIPPGFYDAGGSMLPLKFRRPTAPYGLYHVIVDRFTGLLFSERMHPKVSVAGDPDTTSFLLALIESSRLWANMMLVRDFGGATGDACVSFKYVEGLPQLEVHDPRWTTPTFKDRSTLELASIEKRYIYPEEVRDPATGMFTTINMWYRRVIDGKLDTLFAPEEVSDEEPNWQVQEQVEHNLGFCPAVWIQNLQVVDDIDGDPDCPDTCFDQFQAIDTLIAQMLKGVIANCDPTLKISTDAPLADVAKGSDNAIKLPAGGEAGYIEISGSGPKSALETMQEVRREVLEVAQCVLEHPDMSNRTATEIQRLFAAMIAKADKMREQYGEKGVKPLLRKMVKAAKQLGEPTLDANGQPTRQVLNLPPRIIKNGEQTQQVAQKLGQGGPIDLQWPDYFEPTQQDVSLATTATVQAKTGGLIDQETASKYVGPLFKVEDVGAMLDRVKAEKAEDQAQLEAMAMSGEFRGGPRPPR